MTFQKIELPFVQTDTPERACIERFKVQLDVKTGARTYLGELARNQDDDAREIEAALPSNCEFLGMTLAELDAITVDRTTSRDRYVTPEGLRVGQLDEARRAARHRARALEYRRQEACISADGAALALLIKRLETHLDNVGERA